MTALQAAIKPTPTQLSKAGPNWKSWAIGYALSIMVFFALTSILIFTSRFQYGPIENTIIVTEATVCNLNESDCMSAGYFEDVTLPHINRSPTSSTTRDWHYKLSFRADRLDGSMQGLYLPRFSESLTLTLNGTIIDDMPYFAEKHGQRWRRPELYILPQGILKTGVNTIEIRLAGYKALGTDLYPIYIGPSPILQKAHDRRYWLTRGAMRVSLISILVATMALIILWILRGYEPLYLWLIIGNLGCTIALVTMAFDHLGFNFPDRMRILVIGIRIFTISLFMFYAAFVQLKLPRLKKIYWLFFLLYIAIVALAPTAYLPTVFAILFPIGFLIGFVISAMVWVFRHKTSRYTFLIMFFSYCGTAVLLSSGSSFLVFSEKITIMPLMPFFPALYQVTVIWLIVSQLLSSLNKAETLSETLQQQVAEKTEKLKSSYETIAKTQRQQTLDQERQRIMMDLHDGIGGHLVNTIAYMENSQLKDPTLKEALENALRDLSFMIDSLENNDSVTTLLGMYRSRVEPLLKTHGLEFNWQIGDEPVMPNPGPSMNLNLLRIIQEAVTNSIKHSDGSIITVKTDSRSVTVSDNGDGFQADQSSRKRDKAGGVGFVSMRKRAKDIGAKIDIEGDEYGTKVTLSW